MRQSWLEANLLYWLQRFAQHMPYTKNEIRFCEGLRSFCFHPLHCCMQRLLLFLKIRRSPRESIECQDIAKQQEALDLPKIRCLSGWNRGDYWASALNKLSFYGSFKEAMKELESGAFVLCLYINQLRHGVDTVFFSYLILKFNHFMMI